VADVEEAVQVALLEGRRCIQCGACSSACPSARATMSFSPRRILLALLTGRRSAVGDDQWLCLLCHTCEAICPNEVRIVNIVEALRRASVRKGVEEGALDAYFEALNNMLSMGVIVPPTSSEAQSFGVAKGLSPRPLPAEIKAELEEVFGKLKEVKGAG